MAQLNVYDSKTREAAATGRVFEGRFEPEAGNITLAAVEQINQQLQDGNDWGELEDQGRALHWLAQRPGE